MTTRIADDYAAIARRAAALAPQPQTVTAAPDAPLPQCTAEEAQQQDDCGACFGAGWTQVYSQHPPAFAECPKCLNPKGLQQP